VLHHVSIEVDPKEVDRAVAFWQLLGFERVEAPGELGGYVTWLERKGTQVHLIHSEAATVPPLGHAAVVVDDFEATFAALETAGHEPERHRELWGEPRAFATMPGGHRVELMAAPPGAARSQLSL
jgi:catechol 2,3-dioxygenase-like lactoylglutathione lyase family enzyme